MGTFLKYFERLSYLMSQGVHQCDIAVMYPVAPGQANLGGKLTTDTAFSVGRTLVDNGYDFIFMDSESLERAEIRDGRLRVSDASYRVLVLPAMRALHWSILLKAQQFYGAGGIVIAAEALPEASDRAGCDDPQLHAVVKEIFGANAAEVAAGSCPEVQHSDNAGIGFAAVAVSRISIRRYDGGFEGSWAWAKQPVSNVYFKTVWTGSRADCRIRFFCDNRGDLYLNDRQLCSGADYSSGWSGEVMLQPGDVLTIDAHDEDRPGTRGTAGMFLAVVQAGKTVLSTTDMKYTTVAPNDDNWRTTNDTSDLKSVDTTNVHPLHRAETAASPELVLSKIQELVPRATESPQPIKAVHRKIGYREVFMVMGSAKKSQVTFRCTGRPELWDPWTDETRPVRVIDQTETSTKVECRWKITKHK